MKLKHLLFFLAIIFVQNLMAFEADITVALDGSGDFTKIQDAIDAVPSNQNDRKTVIFIKNGVYDTEKLIIPSIKKNVTFIGESRDQTIISYHIYDCSSPESGNKCPAEDAAKWSGENIRTSATLTIVGEGFRAENLTIQNTAGPVGQALAITVKGDKTVFVNCDILGYQDTIYLWTNGKRSYFKNCLVLGRTDYIYGAGIGFFDQCEIRSYGGGWITAPSTPKSQPYGYVFSGCDITYATGSPRNGDDGALVRLGRPWHEYPKVAWLNCAMTEKIHPEGWGDTWNMDYAATSPDLHLYEYNNAGPGADMSGRANWVGIKALNEAEAAAYSPAKVLNGNDGWAPYEEPPLVSTYAWDGGAADNNWLTPENWNPDGTPASAEVANIIGDLTVDANGGSFAADLNLKAGAHLKVTGNSTVAYLTGENATISSSADASLSGKIATKDTIILSTSSRLSVNAQIFGIHKIVKTGDGTVSLNGDNLNFSGRFIIKAGSINAQSPQSLGKASVEIEPGTQLIIEDDAAFFPESSLKVVSGSLLKLSANVTLSEFYINNEMQNVGVYTATTHGDLISGTGSIIVGRPNSFVCKGGSWDDANNFSPALLPEAGETVYCEGEMETGSTTNLANIIFVESKGKLRLRGVHSSTGSLTFEGNQRISYATSGDGFSVDAPIILEGDISCEMSSANTNGSTMKLMGPISGGKTLSVKHTRDAATPAMLWLGGDNAAFTGTWDVTSPARNVEGSVGILGKSAHAFGSGIIEIGTNNFVQFDHSESSSIKNSLTLASGAKAIVNKDVTLGFLRMGNTTFESGVFSAITHPEFIEGTGTIVLTPNGVNHPRIPAIKAYYANGQIVLSEEVENLKIISLSGIVLHNLFVSGSQASVELDKGVYVLFSNKKGALKLMVNN